MAKSTNQDKLKYWGHKDYARNRVDANGDPIEFRLTFEEWLHIWESSGKYHLRGVRKGCYCMARHNDIGHYEVGNVSIVPIEKNLSEANLGKPSKIKGRPSPHKGKSHPSKGKPNLKNRVPRPSGYVPVRTPLGDFESVKAAAKAHNVVGSTIQKRIKKRQDYYYL